MAKPVWGYLSQGVSPVPTPQQNMKSLLASQRLSPQRPSPEIEDAAQRQYLDLLYQNVAPLQSLALPENTLASGIPPNEGMAQNLSEKKADTTIKRKGKTDPQDIYTMVATALGGDVPVYETDQYGDYILDEAGQKKVVDKKTLPGIPEFLEQKKGIEDLRRLSKMYAEGYNPQLDITPLMNLADMWSGTKMAQNYKKPKTVEDFLGTAFGIDEKIQKRQEALIGGLQKLIKERDSGEDIIRKLSELDRANEVLKRTNAPEKQQAGLLKDLRKNVDDKVITPLSKMSTALNNMQSALDSGSYTRVQQALGALARSISDERGNMSEGDIQRVLPATLQNTIARLETYFTSNSQVDPEVLKELRMAVKDARKNMYEGGKTLLETKKALYSTKDFDIVRPDADRIFEAGLKGLELVKPKDGVGSKKPSGVSSGKTAPKSGEVYKGYKFKGGDPADKNNWEKV